MPSTRAHSRMRSGWSLRKRISRSRSHTWFDPVPPNGPLGWTDTVFEPDVSAGGVNGCGPGSVGLWDRIVWGFATCAELLLFSLGPQPATATNTHSGRARAPASPKARGRIGRLKP